MPFFFFFSHKYLEHEAGAELKSRAHFSAKGTLFYGLLDICLPALKILQSEFAIFPEICFFTKNPDLFLMSHRNYREPRVVPLVAKSPLRAFLPVCSACSSFSLSSSHSLDCSLTVTLTRRLLTVYSSAFNHPSWRASPNPGLQLMFGGHP